MPNVSLTLHQTTSVTPGSGGATYQATSVVEASRGIDKAVFVFRTDTQGFDHHATTADLEVVTTSLELAVAERQPFYRKDSVTRTWPTLSLMQKDIMFTRANLGLLVRAVARAQRPVIIDETIEIEAG